MLWGILWNKGRFSRGRCFLDAKKQIYFLRLSVKKCLNHRVFRRFSYHAERNDRKEYGQGWIYFWKKR